MNENNDPMNEVVQELRKIKVFTGMAGIALVLMLISTILSTILSIGALALIMPNALKTIEKADRSSFSNQTRELIKQDKLDEALAKIADRKTSHPNDPYAHYYEAKIDIMQGRPKKALIGLEELRVIAPGWEEEYIAPHVKLAEKQIAESEEK